MGKIPAYFQKNDDTDMFSEWKKFILLKGYKPRKNISSEIREKTGLTEAESLEEIALGKWASRVHQRPLPTAELRVEFYRIWQDTPTYIQKYRLTKSRAGTNEIPDYIQEYSRALVQKVSQIYLNNSTDNNFGKWKKFIAKKGYRPRTAISPRVTVKTGLSRNTRLEQKAVVSVTEFSCQWACQWKVILW